MSVPETRAASPASGAAPRLLATVLLTMTPVLIGLGAVLASARPDGAGAVAAVFPPWWTPAQIFEAAGAGGDIIRLGQTSFVVVVGSDAPGLAARLTDAGALLLLDPVALSLCQPRSSQGLQP